MKHRRNDLLIGLSLTTALKLLVFVCAFYSHTKAQATEDLQRSFVELRFGAFIHYSIMTYTGAPWATPHQDVASFNPTGLDCGQWARSMKAAKMKFAIFTTKHHDGFCLWNSAATENDIAKSPYKAGHGDVVREFVDSFRVYGIAPCLYYSIWDNTRGVGNSAISQADIQFIKTQLTELLTNYGEIAMLFIDGWSWKIGHKNVPYDEIRQLVKSLQPNCLLVDNTHLPCLYNNDLLHFEAGAQYPKDNTYPAIFSLLINKNSGNDWFWDNRVPTADLLSVNEIVFNNLAVLEPQWCNFILNCPPNKEGKLDSSIVKRLEDVGSIWNPNLKRPPLPKQESQNQIPIAPMAANSATGNAEFAIDGFNDRYNYTVWQSGTVPASITIDLGKMYADVNYLAYVPKYKPYITPMTEGSIKKYKISVSIDNVDYNEVASGTWSGDTKMKVVQFEPVAARYIKIEALTADSNFVCATEFAIGRK